MSSIEDSDLTFQATLEVYILHLGSCKAQPFFFSELKEESVLLSVCFFKHTWFWSIICFKVSRGSYNLGLLTTISDILESKLENTKTFNFYRSEGTVASNMNISGTKDTEIRRFILKKLAWSMGGTKKRQIHRHLSYSVSYYLPNYYKWLGMRIKENCKVFV